MDNQLKRIALEVGSSKTTKATNTTLQPLTDAQKKRYQAKTDQILQEKESADLLYAELVKKEREQKVKEYTQIINQVGTRSLEIAEYYEELKEIETAVNANFKGNQAEQLLDLIQSARNLCETAVSDLNSVGKEAAYQVRINGDATCVYNDIKVQSKDKDNKTTNETFSCNTKELSEILERLKRINNNLGKTAGDIDKISLLDGCQDVKKIPDKIDSAQEQVTQTYNKLDKIITEVEETEAKNKSIIDKGLKLLDKAGDFFKKIFGKKNETQYLLEDAETTTTTTSETFDLPQLKKYDPIGELKKYRDNREKLERYKDIEKNNDEYPWLKIVQENEQKGTETSIIDEKDENVNEWYDPESLPETTLYDHDGFLYYEQNGLLVKETFCQDSLKNSYDLKLYILTKGYDSGYWIRDDGVQMMGERVMYATNIEHMDGKNPSNSTYKRGDAWNGTSGPGDIVGLCEASEWCAQGTHKDLFTNPEDGRIADVMFDTYTAWQTPGQYMNRYYKKDESNATRNIISNSSADTEDRYYQTNESWNKFFRENPQYLPEGTSIDETDWEEYFREKDPERNS